MGRRRAEMALRSAQSIEINGRSLESLLAEHADWLSANDGPAASLSPVSLTRADLHDADLRGRDLRRCDLAGADLRGADVSGSDFRNAIVTGANFQKSEASATNLADARFGGADLAIANLPRGALLDFETAARAATRFHISAAITALVALGMTAAVLVTRDWALFNDSSFIPGLAWSTYYRSAPFVLGLVLALFLRYAVRPFILRVRELPALSNDGKELGARTALWPANLLLSPTMPRLDGELRDGFFTFNRAVSALAIWALIPTVIVAHWMRYLPRHSDAVTLSHVAMSCLIAGAALADFQRSKITAGRLQRVHPILAALMLGCGLGAFSLGVYQGWVPVHLEIAFQQLEIPVGSGDSRDFRDAAISYCDMRGIDLAGARLGGGRILFSDLRGASFQGADLSNASLYGSNLDGAIFGEADLSGADLSCAKLLSVEALGNAKVDETTTLPDGKTGPVGDRVGLILPDRSACEAWAPTGFE